MKFIKTLKSRNGNPLRLDTLEDHIKNMCLRHKILLLYIYGSYAHNRAGTLSDLDIAYLKQKNKTLQSVGLLLEELQDIFEEEAIDLVDLQKVPITLIHRIFKEGRCIYAEDLTSKIEFETTMESKYLDSRFMRQDYFINLEGRIQNGTYGN